MLHRICGRLVATVAVLNITAATFIDNGQRRCSPDIFQDIHLFGGQVLEIKTAYLTDISSPISLIMNQYPMPITNLNVCEVLVTHTHPGQNDILNTWIWLPRPDRWNERFMGTGGGGWSTGYGNLSLYWPASQGYAAIATDGGHTVGEVFTTPDWALSSPGNVNWQLLQDFASVGIDDATVLGKAVVKAYYGQSPVFSYWSGCSTGGRQGHMFAQRFPDHYDGILATAPAFQWAEFIVAEFWPQLIINEMNEYPSSHELEVIRLAAIEACDMLDGVKDGIISYPTLCEFDPAKLVGTEVNISAAAATLASAAWAGPLDLNSKTLWYGLNQEAPLDSLAGTVCDNATCAGVPFKVAEDWIRLFLLADPDFDVTTINRTSFAKLFRQSINRFDSIIGTSDIDLTDFRDAGGKLIIWHGLADELIPPNNSLDYVRRLYDHDPNASEYYRYFEAPGVLHCYGGPGWFPGDAMASLINWVESGIAPDTLEARSVAWYPGDVVEDRTVNLCAWPKTIFYLGGDPNKAQSFGCR